jgi:serine/threonine protein kinase
LCDQRLLPDNGSLVFVGKLSSTHPPGGEIVVKFTRRYGPEVHDFCNDHNCAPALLGFEKLDGGWFLVVMERLRGYEMLGPATENVVAVQQVLKEIVGQFHEHNMVHGDLRAPNIMLHPNTKDVKLIDFDWAGVQGNVRYPPNLSEDITWPEGVSDGELILPAHDDYFIDSLV